MKKLNGSQIVSSFIQELKRDSNNKLESTSISKNVYKFIRKRDVLIYVKGRAGEPHKWGVTKNVIHRLESQSLPWFIVLLYDTPQTGYLLSKNNVDQYISTVWPLGADGDYKPATGTYLENNSPFTSVELFSDHLASNLCS